MGLRRAMATMSPHPRVLEELKMSDFDTTSRRIRNPSLSCVIDHWSTREYSMALLRG
jgi:hypothetical protein